MEEILGAENPFHYRNKSQYPVGADGTIGFFRARSHEVVPVKRCLIQSEASDQTAAAVGNWMKRYRIPAYDERSGKGLIRHVYVRVNQAGESLCCIVVNGKQVPKEPELAALIRAAAPKTVGVLINTNTRRGNVILGEKYRTIWGQDFLMDTLCGLTFKLSVPSFYQVNRDQAEVLYGKALEFASLTGQETVLLHGRKGEAGAGRGDRAGGHPGRQGECKAQRDRERGIFLRRRIGDRRSVGAAGPAAGSHYGGPAPKGTGPVGD